jgi:protein TonB
MMPHSQDAGPALKGTLALSAGMHTVLVALLFFSAFYGPRGDAWAAPGGGSVSVGLVGSLPGVPLPRPAVISTSRVVDPSRGLYKNEARPRPEAPDATSLPDFDRNRKKPVPSKPSRLLEDNSPPPPGAIPYGQGGAPSLPYTQFTMGAGTAGGMGVGGPAGAGFGARFPWYVEAVQRRISGNWYQSTIDPAIRFAPRVAVEFQIFRDGSAGNLQRTQSSGNASVDNSALRAVQESIPFPSLPPEYAGSYVTVEFWFEFHR